MLQEEQTLSDRGPASVGHDPGVLLAPEVKSRSNQSNTMPQLSSLQEVWSMGQIFFPKPAVTHGIIPSPSNLMYNPAFCLLVWYNPLNLIILSVSHNDRIWGPYWVSPGKYGCSKLTWKILCTALTFPISYNLYVVFPTQLRTSNSTKKCYCSLEKPGSLGFLVFNKTLSPT